MAEYRDFFKLAHDDSYDKQPLVKLRDNDRIPDLRKYTMGDLRSWVAENSPGLPSVLPKGVIRASSQLANGIVTTDKIVDGAVTPAKIDWAQMPPVTLASYNAHIAASAYNTAGFAMPFSSSTRTAIPGSLGPLDLPGLLPARAGYSRQFRLVAAFTHLNAAGETAWLPVLVLEGTAVQIPPAVNNNVTTHDEAYASAWIGDPYLNSATVPLVGYLGCRVDYLGAVATTYLRGAILEGRYVPA